MALRAFLCWVLAGEVANESLDDVPRGARGAGRVQGVRRDARCRGPPRRPRGARAGQGQLPDLAGRHGRGRGQRTPGRRWRRWPGRSGRCATPSWCSSAARSWRSCCPPRSTTRPGEERARLSGASPRAGRRGPRAAVQRRPAPALGLPHAVHGVPAARQAVPRLGGQARAAARRSSSASAGLGNAIGIGLGNVLRNVRPAAVVVLVLDRGHGRGDAGGAVLRAAHGGRCSASSPASARPWASCRSTR